MVKAIKVTKFIIVVNFVVMILSAHLFAQTNNTFNKSLPNGNRIFARDYTITEFRSRPANVNQGIPAEKLFERQEWKLRSYELWLQTPNNQEQELFWTFQEEYEINPKVKTYLMFGLTFRDVYHSKSESYVLYKTAFGLIVATVENRKNINRTNPPSTFLERDYGFRPIFNARFKPGKKPVIEAEYLTYEYEADGSRKRKTWTWKLSNKKWKKI